MFDVLYSLGRYEGRPSSGGLIIKLRLLARAIINRPGGGSDGVGTRRAAGRHRDTAAGHAPDRSQLLLQPATHLSIGSTLYLPRIAENSHFVRIFVSGEPGEA